MEGEITPKLFGEFAIWVVYQLYGIDYNHLAIIEDAAFKALYAMLIMGGENIYKKYYDKLSARIDDIMMDLDAFIEKVSSDIVDARNQSTGRNEFADAINANPASIYSYSPEAKGIALYILTADGAYDRVDINNQGDGFLPDTGKNRKTAVLYILSSIQTKREWKKVLSRITKNGTAFAGSEDNAVELAQKNLKIFLQIGFNRDKELEDIIDRLELRDFEAVTNRLKGNPTYGYSFSANCTKQYLSQCDDNPFYTSLCDFEPTNTQYQQQWKGNE